MYRKNRGHKMVTKCCRGAYIMRYGNHLCKLCNNTTSIMRDDGVRPVQIFPAYKPPYKMSSLERNNEILKRSAKVSEYTNSLKGLPADERKFIEERIKWNNERIALLLG